MIFNPSWLILWSPLAINAGTGASTTDAPKTAEDEKPISSFLRNMLPSSFFVAPSQPHPPTVEHHRYPHLDFSESEKSSGDDFEPVSLSESIEDKSAFQFFGQSGTSGDPIDIDDVVFDELLDIVSSSSTYVYGDNIESIPERIEDSKPAAREVSTKPNAFDSLLRVAELERSKGTLDDDENLKPSAIETLLLAAVASEEEQPVELPIPATGSAEEEGRRVSTLDDKEIKKHYAKRMSFDKSMNFDSRIDQTLPFYRKKELQKIIDSLDKARSKPKDTKKARSNPRDEKKASPKERSEVKQRINQIPEGRKETPKAIRGKKR
jgi:hypothetical protein